MKECCAAMCNKIPCDNKMLVSLKVIMSNLGTMSKVQCHLKKKSVAIGAGKFKRGQRPMFFFVSCLGDIEFLF